MKKIVALVLAVLALCLLVAADYNVSASKTTSSTMLKMKEVHLYTDNTIKVDYCWTGADGAEQGCDNATDTVKDTDASPVFLRAKALMKAKEGVK